MRARPSLMVPVSACYYTRAGTFSGTTSAHADAVQVAGDAVQHKLHGEGGQHDP